MPLKTFQNDIEQKYRTVLVGIFPGVVEARLPAAALDVDQALKLVLALRFFPFRYPMCPLLVLSKDYLPLFMQHRYADQYARTGARARRGLALELAWAQA